MLVLAPKLLNLMQRGALIKVIFHSAVCGGTISQTESMSGTITSPGYPDNYRHNVNCTWTFQPNDSKYWKKKFYYFFSNVVQLVKHILFPISLIPPAYPIVPNRKCEYIYRNNIW